MWCCDAAGRDRQGRCKAAVREPTPWLWKTTPPVEDNCAKPLDEEISSSLAVDFGSVFDFFAALLFSFAVMIAADFKSIILLPLSRATEQRLGR